MMHEENGTVKAKQVRVLCFMYAKTRHFKVEVNNFASGAAALAMRTLRVHRHILRRLWDEQSSQEEVQSSLKHYELWNDNAGLSMVVQGLIAAWCEGKNV